MSNLKKVVAAARETSDSIRKSAWIEKPTSEFVANAFAAFADDLERKNAVTMVHVVMANDFPEAVFLHEAAADAFIEAEKKVPKVMGMKIHWRSYAFELREEKE